VNGIKADANHYRNIIVKAHASVCQLIAVIYHVPKVD